MENRNRILFEEQLALIKEYTILSNEVTALNEQIQQKRIKMDSIACEMTILCNQILLNDREKMK